MKLRRNAPHSWAGESSWADFALYRPSLRLDECFWQKVPTMTIEFFAESNVGTRTLPRSLATKAGGFVFVGGQVARDENGNLIAEGIGAQTRQTMRNVAEALAFAGCTFEDVVKTMVWLDDARDFEEFNRVYSEFFPGNKPTRSTIQAKNMVNTKIEIEVIAYRP